MPWVCASVDEPLTLVECAERRLDIAVVGDVVPAIGLRRRVPRIDPDRVDPELGEVGQPRAHPLDIAEAVTVGIGERPDVHLVRDRRTPPVAALDGFGIVGGGGGGSRFGHGERL